jgi:hydrogenase maturation protease
VTDGVLVVGFGNALRTDDGVGRAAAERCATDPRLDGATVMARHQLTPELALDVSRAAGVIFIDASHGPPAGTLTIGQLDPDGGGGTLSSHHVSPTSLVQLALELFGRAPAVWLVSVGVESMEPGDRLSPVVEAAIPRLVDAVVALAAEASAVPHGA